MQNRIYLKIVPCSSVYQYSKNIILAGMLLSNQILGNDEQDGKQVINSLVSILAQ